MYSLKVHIPFAYFSEVIQDIPKSNDVTTSECKSPESKINNADIKPKKSFLFNDKIVQLV